MEKIDKGLNWIEKTLNLVNKYRIWDFLKAIFVILLIAGTVGLISNPTWLFEQYAKWQEEKHTEKMLTRAENDVKIHSIIEKLNYRTNSSRVLILEYHNGTDGTGGLPFRKCSATYEAINVGVMPVADQWQGNNLSLMPFASYMATQGYWCGNTDDMEKIDRSLSYRLKSYGIEHFSAVTIEGVDKPLAMMIVAYDAPHSSEEEHHNCMAVRENIRHCSLEIALLLQLNTLAK